MNVEFKMSASKDHLLYHCSEANGMRENKTQTNYFKVIPSRHYQQNRQQLLHIDSLRLDQLLHYMAGEARDAWAITEERGEERDEDRKGKRLVRDRQREEVEKELMIREHTFLPRYCINAHRLYWSGFSTPSGP